MCFSCMLSLCKFTKKHSRKKEQQRVLDCLKDMQHTQIETFEDLPQNQRRCFHAAFLPKALRQKKYLQDVWFRTFSFSHKSTHFSIT